MNPSVSPVTYKITEMALGGGETKEEMGWDKVTFNTVDDELIDMSFIPRDKSALLISLEPQRIRTYLIDYNP